MKSQKERLLEFVAYLGLSNNQFEKSIGASCGTIAHMKSAVSAAVIDKVVRVYPMLNRVWLQTGSGAMIINPDETVNNAYATGGSAAAVYGNATVQSGAEEALKVELERLRAEVKELKAEKAKLYDLLMTLRG